MSAPQVGGNLNGLRFTDRILCSAVETEAGYLAKIGWTTTASTWTAGS